MSHTQDLGRRMSPSMERAGAGFRDKDVTDADLRETPGIAGEMRVGRGELGGGMLHQRMWTHSRNI
jgi:hypothetical protein